MQDRAFSLFLVLLSLSIAAAMPMLVPVGARETFAEAMPEIIHTRPQPRQLQAVSYAFPGGFASQTHTYTREQLLRGRMLLVDDAHPLPAEAPAPNTMSIAVYGKGMVPVRSLKLKSGRETIAALTQWFRAMNAHGVNGLTVWEGSTSSAEQREMQIAAARERMRRMSCDQAAEETLAATDRPGSGELQQEYTVGLRFRTGDASTPDSRPLEATRQGQVVLQTSWRYGFVRSQPQGRGAYRFRWVGKAHATAMTYLDLTLEEYLTWMHEKGVLTIYEAKTPKYVILCKPMTGTHIAFSVPEGASCEASLDNMGYAIVACTLP